MKVKANSYKLWFLILILILNLNAYVWAQSNAGSRLENGVIHLVQSSHHDLGWHKLGYPAEMRFTFDEIDKALDLMKEDAEFKFTGEYTVWLQEYLKHRPDREEELKQRFQEGKMEWGAGYTMPYTSMVTSEQLARQMYFGRRWFNNEFPARGNIYFNTDVPAFGIQMPQILRKSGVKKAFLSRSWNLSEIDTDFVDWTAPDGSGVFCYFMHHYGDQVRRYRDKNIANNERTEKWVRSLENDYSARGIPPQFILFLCQDCRMPDPYRNQIDEWNAYARPKGLPQMRYSTLETPMDAVNIEGANFKALSGEWPNKWVYEGAPSNYEIVSDQRESDRLLRAAEAFSTFRALLEGSFSDYPAEKLEEAWKKSTFSCHGFAPDKVVNLYKETYKAARDVGEQLLGEALGVITRSISTETNGLPLVVYNTLSWNRTDVVELELPKDLPAAFKVVDHNGTVIPHQITREGHLLFRAAGVPSLGYKTYYLVEGNPVETAAGPWRAGTIWEDPFENAFFIIEPGNGGIRQIHDKELNRDLLKVDRFLGAEWLDYEYTGQGAGEHTHIELPSSKGFDRLQNYESNWSCIESGPVCTVFESEVVETPRGKVQLLLTAYASLKRIDLDCRMLDCDEKEARQVRLAFPLNADRREVAYEVPFGVVKIGSDEVDPGLVAGKASVRPREIQNWIYAGSDKGGVTIGSSVVAWDYDVIGQRRPVPVEELSYPVLQPVLLTSAYSCNRAKKCWTQPGDHTFTFSIFSHQPGWQRGHRKGVESNNPLIPVLQKEKHGSPALSETKSFMSISAANVDVTAVKKSEDGNDMIVRFYEVEGKDGNLVRLNPAAGLADARHTNLIEEEAGPLKHDKDAAIMKIGAYSIETVKLRLELAAPSDQ